MWIDTATKENSMEAPQKIKKQEDHMIQQLYFWVFFWKNKNTNLKRYLPAYVQRCIVYTSQDKEAT